MLDGTFQESLAICYLKELLPTEIREIPEKSESWQEIMEDMNRVIIPGITHWQAPNFHTYLPTQTF
jgi:hypothetical protein